MEYKPISDREQIASVDKLSRIDALPLFSVIGCGAILRFFMLGRQSFWYDEAVSARLAVSPLADLVSGKVRDLGNPPLHSILLHLWARVFGSSEASLRALSATVGTASIPALYCVARRLAGSRVAIAATTIFALSPLHIYFAQEARTFALTTLLVIVSMYLLLRLVESPYQLRLWTAFCVVTFLSMYSHYFAAFVILGQLTWVLTRHRGNRPLVIGLLVALVVAAVMYLVWLPSLIEQMTAKGNLGRSADTWYLHFLSTPLVFGVGTTLLWKDTVTPLRLTAAVLAVVAFSLAALAGVRTLRTNRQALALTLTWLLLPLLIPLAISLTLFPLFCVRYALPATPAFCILVGAGLSDLHGRLRAGILAVMTATCGLSLYFYFTTLVKHDWRSAEAWVKSATRPGDVVAFDADIGETAFAYYGGTDESRIRLTPPPPNTRSGFFGVSPQMGPSHPVDQQILEAPRLWFVYSDAKTGAGTYYSTLLTKELNLIASRQFRGVEVFLFQRKP